MNEVMTAEEINARFESEWVLIANPETEENLMLKGGRVLWHGKDRAEMYRKIAELPKPLNLTLHYTGTISEEQAIAYKLWMMSLSLHGSPT
jgi:hypothetical protein